MNPTIRAALNDLLADPTSIAHEAISDFKRNEITDLRDLAHDTITDYLTTLVDELDDDARLALENEIEAYFTAYAAG